MEIYHQATDFDYYNAPIAATLVLFGSLRLISGSGGAYTGDDSVMQFRNSPTPTH